MALFQNTQPTMIGPNLNSQVDYNNETVEGRIGNLLGTDQKGNYSNPLVRQAQERQEQAFNTRGLLNSSMAMQAGSEAAISKAIDIATPDARTYYDNRRGNVDATNTFARDQQQFLMDRDKQQTQFQLDQQKQDSQNAFLQRQDYQKALQAVGTNFQRQMDTINASDMTPEDKSVAIAQLQAQRDGEIAFQNNLYSRMPQWQQEWLAPSIATSGMNLAEVSNLDTLATIANDPGQPAELRAQAQQRLQELRGGGGSTGGSSMIGGLPMSGITPGAATASNGQPLPQFDSAGQRINWDARPAAGGYSLREQYEMYSRQPELGPMTPQTWLLWRLQNGLGAGHPGSDDGSAAAAAAAAAAADSGISPGISV